MDELVGPVMEGREGGTNVDEGEREDMRIRLAEHDSKRTRLAARLESVRSESANIQSQVDEIALETRAFRSRREELSMIRTCLTEGLEGNRRELDMILVEYRDYVAEGVEDPDRFTIMAMQALESLQRRSDLERDVNLVNEEYTDMQAQVAEQEHKARALLRQTAELLGKGINLADRVKEHDKDCAVTEAELDAHEG